jgi:hypothetical protein
MDLCKSSLLDTDDGDKLTLSGPYAMQQPYCLRLQQLLPYNHERLRMGRHHEDTTAHRTSLPRRRRCFLLGSLLK